MSAETPERPDSDAADLKQCCARLYENGFAKYLLGDSFHPGGAALTRRLGERLQIRPGVRVLDVASGPGTSAMLLAEHFGADVIGIDLSARNVATATAEVSRCGLSEHVRFIVADAECLPIADGTVDAIVCECAFCTFPDKAATAGEFARVLAPGGRIGLSDVTREPGHAGEFDDLMAWIACLADAMPAEAYADWLRRAGLASVAVERHDEALMDLVRSIGTRLLAGDILVGLDRLDISGVDFTAARRLARQAMTAVREGRLGYAIIVAGR